MQTQLADELWFGRKKNTGYPHQLEGFRKQAQKIDQYDRRVILAKEKRNPNHRILLCGPCAKSGNDSGVRTLSQDAGRDGMRQVRDDSP
jgi:hypothetical protein